MKHSHFYMDVAEAAARNSHAVRKQVGACLVTNNQVILSGWNGMPAGMDNTCEHVPFELPMTLMDGTNVNPISQLVTKPEVIHAEMNAISKAAREGVSTLGSTLFVTLSPCVECAKMLVASGVKEVVYKENYRDTSGIDFLKKCNVVVTQYQDI